MVGPAHGLDRTSDRAYPGSCGGPAQAITAPAATGAAAGGLGNR